MAKTSFKVFCIFIGLCFLVIFSLRYDPEVMKIDKGYYQSYTQSIIEDGDFNITNQVSEKFNWIVTKTYNHPDFHDHGISVLWAPFFLYAKGIEALGGDKDVLESKSYNTAQVIAGYFFGLLTILLTLKLLKIFWKNNHRKYEIIAGLVFGTPFFWHLIFHPSNSDITVTILPVITLFLFFSVMKLNNWQSWFGLGVWLGYAVIGKITMAFYFLLPLYGLYLLYQQKGLKIVCKSVASFTFGVMILQGSFHLNEWIKFGIPINGYLATVNTNYYLLFETFLGPIGYFYISPIYFLGIPAIYVLIKYKESNWKLGLVLFSIPVAKMVIESFTFAVVGDLGARHYIIDLCAFIIVYSRVVNLYKWASRVFISSACIWMMLMCIWFSFNISQRPMVWGQDYLRDLSFLENEVSIMLYRANIFNGLDVWNLITSLAPYFPLIGIVSLVLVLVYQAKAIPFRILWGGAMSCCLVYLLFTCLNISLNEVNTANQKKNGLYKGSVVGNGMEIYLYDENVGALVDTVNFFKYRKKIKFAAGAQQVLDQYLFRVKNQIVVDPIGLEKLLSSGGMRDPYN